MSNTVNELFFGGDIGHGYTKTELAKFPSRVKVGKRLGFGKNKKDTHEVQINGQDYIVGEGAIFTGDDRYFTVEYKVALLTAIALNNPTEDFIETTAVIGVPIERHSRIAKKVQDYFTGLQETLFVNGKEITIRIKQLVVWIEGAYPILTGEDGIVITIDMGAGTINVSQFEDGVATKWATYGDSMYVLYQNIATYLNTEFGGDFKPMDIEPLLNRTSVVINQQQVDITSIRPMIDSAIAEMASNIRNSFNIGRANAIYNIGGGSMDTFKYWKKNFKNAILVEDSQNINHKVFNKVAKALVTVDEE